MDAEPTDAELMLAFQRGELPAFEELFRRHRTALYAFVMRLARDATTAEEISQHAWLTLVEVVRRGAYQPDANAQFRTYLLTLARNRYFDEYVRKHGQSRTTTMAEPPVDAMAGPWTGSSPPEREAMTEETRRILEELLQELPDEQREVIALWIADVSIDETAQMTGAPRNTVLSRRRYAIGRLRSRMTDLGIDLESWEA